MFYYLASSTSPNKSSLPSEAPTASTSQQVVTSSQQVGKDKVIIDFFSSIEEEVPTAFNPQNPRYDTRLPLSKPTDSQLSVGSVPAAPNPFARTQPQIAIQPTGFIVPQQTAVPPPNPFGNFLGKQPQQQPTHQPFSSYISSQPTGFQQLQQPQTSGFLQSPQQTSLQPQPTGINPFRHSMLVPQSTGMALFGARQGLSAPNGHQSFQGTPLSLPGGSAFPQPPTMPLPAPTPSIGASSNSTPTRPSSTPLTSFTTPLQSPQPVKSHQTGTKNPFGPITSSPPPVPKAPTLLELTTGRAVTNGNASQSQQSAQQQMPQQQTGASNKYSFNNSTLYPGATDISSVASSFTFNPNTATSGKSSSINSGVMGPQQTGTTTTGSTLSDSRFSSPLSQSTNTSTPTIPGSPSVTSHVTGFGGVKPFIPSSSFGASLMESLSISGSSPTSPTTSGTITNGFASSSGANNSSLPSSNGTGNYSFLNSQSTGATGGFSGASSTYKSSLGVGLRPQMTGGGSVNPFRASSVGGPSFGGSTSFQPMGSSQPLGANIFGIHGGPGAFGAQGQQSQPYGTALWFGHGFFTGLS